MHTVSGFLLWQALTAEPEFTGAQQKPSWAGVCAVLCVMVEALAAVVTCGCVRGKVLRAWW